MLWCCCDRQEPTYQILPDVAVDGAYGAYDYVDYLRFFDHADNFRQRDGGGWTPTGIGTIDEFQNPHGNLSTPMPINSLHHSAVMFWPDQTHLPNSETAYRIIKYSSDTRLVMSVSALDAFPPISYPAWGFATNATRTLRVSIRAIDPAGHVPGTALVGDGSWPMAFGPSVSVEIPDNFNTSGFVSVGIQDLVQYYRDNIHPSFLAHPHRANGALLFILVIWPDWLNVPNQAVYFERRIPVFNVWNFGEANPPFRQYTGDDHEFVLTGDPLGF